MQFHLEENSLGSYKPLKINSSSQYSSFLVGRPLFSDQFTVHIFFITFFLKKQNFIWKHNYFSWVGRELKTLWLKYLKFPLIFKKQKNFYINPASHLRCSLLLQIRDIQKAQRGVFKNLFISKRCRDRCIWLCFRTRELMLL